VRMLTRLCASKIVFCFIALRVLHFEKDAVKWFHRIVAFVFGLIVNTYPLSPRETNLSAMGRWKCHVARNGNCCSGGNELTEKSHNEVETRDADVGEGRSVVLI